MFLSTLELILSTPHDVDSFRPCISLDMPSTVTMIGDMKQYSRSGTQGTEEKSSLVKTEQKNELKVEAHSDAETGTLSALCNVTMSLPRSGEMARQNF